MGAARLRRARGGGPGARRHPRRARADAGAARDALPPRQPHAAVAPRHGGCARDGNERARRRRPAAAQRLARGRPAGIPPVARAPEPVRTRVQARGRARGRGLGRREPAAGAGPVAARRNEPPGGRRIHPGRSHHRRHAQGCGAVARRLAGYAHSRQGRRSGRAGRQPGGRHRRDPAHRVRHDTRTHRQTRFAEENVDKIGLAFVAAAIIAACGKGETGNENRGYDLLLKNGWIVDGSGNPRYRGGVAVRGDRIAAVGFLGGAQARETLDVAGLVVAPGFIDMMGQSEINALIDNRVFSKITQGITTEVTGEGGSVAPLTDQLVLDDSDAMKKWHYREDWRDLDGYFAQLAKQGSLGLWTALEYAPASYSTTDEIIALAKAARRHGGIYASHMRNEGIRIDDALGTRCSASRAKPTYRRRSHTSRCRVVRAGVACPGCSPGSIRPGPRDSTSRPTNTRTRVRRPRSTPRFRPGRRAEGGTPCWRASAIRRPVPGCARRCSIPRDWRASTTKQAAETAC